MYVTAHGASVIPTRSIDLGKIRPETTTAQARPRRRRRPEEVRARILEAALKSFANRGYEGATVQQIAQRAKVSVPLIIYHFQSKENLWKETVQSAVRRFDDRIRELGDDAALSASDKLRQIIVSMVRVSCEFPEFHQLMSLEGHEMTDRLEWLLKYFVKRHFRAMTAIISAAQDEGSVRQVPPERLSHAIVGMANIFTQAAEFQAITGRNLASDAEVRKTIDTINQLVFIEPATEPGKPPAHANGCAGAGISGKVRPESRRIPARKTDPPVAGPESF